MRFYSNSGRCGPRAPRTLSYIPAAPEGISQSRMRRVHHLRREMLIPAPIAEVFEFFADVRNLEAITPGWLRFRILTPTPIEMEDGALIEYRLSWWFVHLRWKTVIDQWKPPHYFVDRQLSGPYTRWEHTHSF